MKLKWDLEHVYFYLVSFVALILVIIGAVNLTRTAIVYITPIYDEYSPFVYEDLSRWEENYGPELLEQEKERYELLSRENYRRGLARDLIGGISFIAFALPVYLYHWRRIPGLEAMQEE